MLPAKLEGSTDHSIQERFFREVISFLKGQQKLARQEGGYRKKK